MVSLSILCELFQEKCYVSLRKDAHLLKNHYKVGMRIPSRQIGHRLTKLKKRIVTPALLQIIESFLTLKEMIIDWSLRSTMIIKLFIYGLSARIKNMI